MTEQRKAVALISGGLDSFLAARTVMDQGVHVEGINFYTGFCVEGHTHAIREKDRARPKRNNALWVAEQLGIRLHIVDIIEEYMDVVINPQHGYGTHLNPCLDCKVFMVNKAREWIVEHDFDFIITGEVVGQRPMSQRKHTMTMVARDSGAGDRLVRPLCAQNLPPTLPEQKGWLERDRMYGFSGRSRRPQMALAAKYGFEDYAQPAGGCCFLTDRQYSIKLEDLWKTRGRREYDLDDIMLLKVGRHLRPRADLKLIVGREEGENRFLEGYRRRFVHMLPASHVGPLVLLDGNTDTNAIELAARLTARFSKGRDAGQVTVEINDRDGNSRMLAVRPMPADEIPADWYL
ncbi:MAG: tRNA (5-methylaminomethyl-2-thiouridylate)-methyltransferase [Halobacteria archaeon]|nr:tRNA (5-methylaminomethyl-2-thiouridylate)-methyltransferase [Halobacteria archaeon]